MMCVPITAEDRDEALMKIGRANRVADCLEIRLDRTGVAALEEMITASSIPAMVTYRSEAEGGQGRLPFGKRVDLLAKAAEIGADYVDVEYALPPSFRDRIFEVRGASRIVLSVHFPEGTPSRTELEEIYLQMTETGTDVIKIVTRATSWEDNLRVLDLIPRAHRTGCSIIAFCMGPLGRIGRVYSHLMGGYMSFVTLEEGEESAPGQIPIREMKKMVEHFWA